MRFMENFLPEFALAPAADRYNGNPATDVYSMALGDEITFLVVEGAGGTGTATITVEGCDNVTPSNVEAIAFSYKTLTGATASDAWADWARATAAGITPAAGANKMTAVSVRAQELPAGKPYVRVQLTEVANDPVAACVIAILGTLKHAGQGIPTALT